MRTIGDPDIRFREDPVRILRAIKFAARCDLTIEPETYRRMLEHAGEIAKCAQARVSEEFYRLLRAGAARRSIELLLETTLLRLLVPALRRVFDERDDAEPETQPAQARGCWAYLAALDRSTARRESPPSNALILATLLLPGCATPFTPTPTACATSASWWRRPSPRSWSRCKASRRDSELARQILLAMRYIFPSSNAGRRRPRFAGREFLDDALRLHEIVSDAEALEPELAGRPLLAEGEAPLSAEAEERLARELETPSEFERRRGTGRAGPRAASRAAEAPPPQRQPTRAPARRRPAATPAPCTAPAAAPPIPDLARLGQRPDPTVPLPFLGTGAFGGRWNTPTERLIDAPVAGRVGNAGLAEAAAAEHGRRRRRRRPRRRGRGS